LAFWQALAPEGGNACGTSWETDRVLSGRVSSPGPAWAENRDGGPPLCVSDGPRHGL